MQVHYITAYDLNSGRRGATDCAALHRDQSHHEPQTPPQPLLQNPGGSLHVKPASAGWGVDAPWRHLHPTQMTSTREVTRETWLWTPVILHGHQPSFMEPTHTGNPRDIMAFTPRFYPSQRSCRAGGSLDKTRGEIGAPVGDQTLNQFRAAIDGGWTVADGGGGSGGTDGGCLERSYRRTRKEKTVILGAVPWT